MGSTETARTGQERAGLPLGIVRRPSARTALRAAEPETAALVSAEELATLALFSIEGIGPATLRALRAAFGSLAAVLGAPRDRVLPVLRDEPTRQRFARSPDLARLAERHLARAEQLGARVLFQGRPDWPRQLAGLEFPPVLYVRGLLEPGRTRLAIVGSRSSDTYGDELAAFFAAGLARAGLSVVSGGAVGIDAAAHRACLGNEGSTVAVLGSGLDVAYPGEHRQLFQEIVARGGALVSHFPPGTPGVPQNFKVRNRLIAALSDAVLVARAGAASGALGTAQAARALNRSVFAIPGDVTSELAAGTNGLLERGEARAATGLDPLLAAVGLGPESRPAGAPAPAERPRARSIPVRPAVATPPRSVEVPADLRSVWEALGEGAVQFDELLGRCALDAAGLANALLRLELIGLCEERLGKVFVRR